MHLCGPVIYYPCDAGGSHDLLSSCLFAFWMIKYGNTDTWTSFASALLPFDSVSSVKVSLLSDK